MWNPESQKVHGIRRDMLRGAPTPSQAMLELNDFLGIGAVAHCDGGSHDAYWLQRLETAADLPASFTMGSLHMIFGNMDEDQKEMLIRRRKDEEPVHRARADAESHVRTLAHVLGCEGLTIHRL